ncbi:MAG: MerR family transcriptional regulator [Magnetococcales bacterium]|nr:MerR family transcriptional regulator [Magnetococcales bacterium]
MTMLPDRSFLDMGEVAAILGVAPHVLRYWEKEFPQIRPLRRIGHRRIYRRQDVDLLLRVRHLLYKQRLTISGVREYLRQESMLPPHDTLREIHRELLDLHRLLTHSRPGSP